jgi:hypothetical protein
MESSVPLSYKIDQDRKLVQCTGFGFVAKEEVFAQQDQLLNDPDFDPSFFQLADFAQLTDTDIGMADLQVIAKRDVFSIHSRRAILVNGDVAFGFAKIFEVYRKLAGAHGIQVFRTTDEALDWLFTPGANLTRSQVESGAGSTLP